MCDGGRSLELQVRDGSYRNVRESSREVGAIGEARAQAPSKRAQRWLREEWKSGAMMLGWQSEGLSWVCQKRDATT